MNKTTARKVNALIDELEIINGQLREILDELQDKFDALSERQQEGKNGQTLAEEIPLLEDLCDALDFANDARPEEVS